MFFKTLQFVLSVSLIKWWLSVTINRAAEKMLDELAEKTAERMRERDY